MERNIEQDTWKEYQEAKKAGDLEAMFRCVDNGRPLYCARTKCNGVANFIKQRIQKIKRLNVKNNFNWFSIQEINRCEASWGDDEPCCIRISLQLSRSSRRGKINPTRKIFADLGLCKNSGGTQPILCSMSGKNNFGMHACFSFTEKPPSDVFDEDGILLTMTNLPAVRNLEHDL